MSPIQESSQAQVGYQPYVVSTELDLLMSAPHPYSQGTYCFWLDPVGVSEAFVCTLTCESMSRL